MSNPSNDWRTVLKIRFGLKALDLEVVPKALEVAPKALALQPKYAWVVLVMKGDAYVPGALVVAQSLKNVGTRHDIVCMVTPDVTPKARVMLAQVFTDVVEVPYISHESRHFTAQKQGKLYNSWMDQAFTKWNVLSLVAWSKVLLVDADMVFIKNSDDLFDLQAPAATFSLAWAQPWVRHGVANPYVARGDQKGRRKQLDLPHGATVPAATVFAALRAVPPTFVGGGWLGLHVPNMDVYKRYLALIAGAGDGTVYGADHTTTSGTDEASIADLYSGGATPGVPGVPGVPATPWTNIHQRYAAIPWKKDWVSQDIHAWHFYGKKPWQESRDEYPDLVVWWEIADQVMKEHPDTVPAFAARKA